MPRKKKQECEVDNDLKESRLSPRRRSGMQSHIKRIKQAKKATENIFDAIKIDAAQASVEILWEFVFDYLCSVKSIDSSEMGTLSSIIQRLASSRVQLANFALKSSNTSQRESNGVLPSDAAEKIEEALHLL